MDINNRNYRYILALLILAKLAIPIYAPTTAVTYDVQFNAPLHIDASQQQQSFELNFLGLIALSNTYYSVCVNAPSNTASYLIDQSSLSMTGYGSNGQSRGYSCTTNQNGCSIFCGNVGRNITYSLVFSATRANLDTSAVSEIWQTTVKNIISSEMFDSLTKEATLAIINQPNQPQANLEITNIGPADNSVVQGVQEIFAYYSSNYPIDSAKTNFTINTADHSQQLIYDNLGMRVSYSAGGLQDGSYSMHLKIVNTGLAEAARDWVFTVNSGTVSNPSCIASGTACSSSQACCDTSESCVGEICKNPLSCGDRICQAGQVCIGEVCQVQAEPVQNQPPSLISNEFPTPLVHPASGIVPLSQYIHDENPSTVAYVGKGNSGISCSVSGQNLNYATIDSFSGRAFCEIGAADDKGLKSDLNFYFNVQRSSDLIVDLIASKTEGSVPLKVDFTASAKGGISPYKYEWDFEGSGAFGAKAGNYAESHTFLEDGTYWPEVRVTDSAGNARTAHLQIKINISAKANKSPRIIKAECLPKEADEDSLITCSADAVDDENDIITYSWDFGDGSNGAGKEAKHSYILPSLETSSKKYSASLIVSDGKGGYDNKGIEIVVKRAYLKIIIDAPFSSDKNRLSKGRDFEVFVRVINYLNEPVTASQIKINQDIIPVRQEEGSYKARFTPSLKTSNEIYIYAEASAPVLNSQRVASAARAVYFEPFEFDADYSTKPENFEIGSKIESITIMPKYPDGSKVVKASIEGKFFASLSKKIYFKEVSEGRYSADIGYVINKYDKEFEINIKGIDNYGNFIDKRINVPLSGINPLFNIRLREPDPRKPALFFYGQEAKLSAALNSSAENRPAEAKIYARSKDLNLNIEMGLNPETKIYEASFRIPDKGQIRKDAIGFTVSGSGYVEGEKYEDFYSFAVALAEKPQKINFTPVVVAIIAAALLFIITYLGYGFFKERQRIRKELGIERKNLLGIDKKLKYEYYKRHISEGEYKERMLKNQQEIETIESMLGLAPQKAPALSRKEINERKEKIMGEMKRKMKEIEKREKNMLGYDKRPFAPFIEKIRAFAAKKDGLSKEEMADVEKIINMIGPRKKDYSGEKILEAMRSEGYNERVIKEVIRRLFGKNF